MVACGNTACGKALSVPLMQCSKCKAEAYCCKACQTAAWKAGHKHKCGAPGQGVAVAQLRRAARGGAQLEAARAPAGLTAQQNRLVARLFELQEAKDWLGVVGLEKEALALARGGQPAATSVILNVLGLGFENTGDYGRARELHEQDRSISETLGDRAGVAGACSNLGNCYESTGDYGRARELHEQAEALWEALGDRRGVARACGSLGNCYYHTGDYGRARALYEQCRTISEGLGDREKVARACSGLGNCYYRTGDYARAREMHEQHRAMAEALGDRAGVATACGNLGNCCLSTGDYGRAISYFTEQYNMAKEMQDERCQAKAALGMGVALRLEIRASVRGRAAGASELPAPRASASACSDDGVREAEKWLQTALDLGHTAARLHLAQLAFYAGHEASAVEHLQNHLAWCVESGRNHCAGCSQRRGEDEQMLTCGGCRVARFCSVEHQKMASKSVAAGGSVFEGRHRDVCALLGKWRQQVVKGGKSPGVLHADLLAFLRK